MSRSSRADLIVIGLTSVSRLSGSPPPCPARHAKPAATTRTPASATSRMRRFTGFDTSAPSESPLTHEVASTLRRVRERSHEQMPHDNQQRCLTMNARLALLGAGVLGIAALVGVGLAVTSPPPHAFQGDDFSFRYPAAWREISGYEHAGMHGPTVLAAVG